MRVLNDLKSLGYEIEAKEGKLKLSFRGEGEPDKEKVVPLLNEIKKYKMEIVNYLKDVEQVQNMSLEAFGKDNLVIKVESTVLGKDILFVSNDEIAKGLKAEGFVVYTAQELNAIVKLNPDSETIKAIHEVKNVFLGSEVIQ